MRKPDDIRHDLNRAFAEGQSTIHLALEELAALLRCVASLQEATSEMHAAKAAEAEARRSTDALRRIVEVIAHADPNDTVGSLDVDIPDGKYPRQWLQAAAEAALKGG